MRLFALIALPVAALLVEGPAAAERPRIELSAHAGYASELEPSVRGDLGSYGVGVGARAGVLLGRFFVGAWFTRHFGTTQSARGPGSSYDAHYYVLLLGPEVGYELRLGERVVLRPSLGGGFQRLAGYTTVQGITLDDASFRPYLTAAVLGAVRFGHGFVGPELRLVAAPLDLPGAWAPSALLVGGAVF